MSSAEARNLLGQTQTMTEECRKRDILDDALKIIGEKHQNLLMEKLGYKEINTNYLPTN